MKRAEKAGATVKTVAANKTKKAARAAKNAAIKAAKMSSTTKVVDAKVSNTIPFVFDRVQLLDLRELFNALYAYRANKVNGLQRVDLFKEIRIERENSWRELSEVKAKECKLTPYAFVRAEIARQIDNIKGRLAASPLEIGEAVAVKVAESTSTGVSTVLFKDYMPIIPGSPKMIKSLAKKKTADGKLFAVKERTTEGYEVTVFRVSVSVDIVNGKEIKTKTAKKESGFIQRFSRTEAAFKKGLVEGIRAIV